MAKELKKAWFTIDGLEDNSYEGYTEGQTWNGWQCPLFELDVALQIAKDLNQVNGEIDSKIVFDEKTHEFINEDYEYPKEQWESFAASEYEGKKLFALGSYGWCWELTTAEPEAELPEQMKKIAKKKM
jgi:hypothetical protein